MTRARVNELNDQQAAAPSAQPADAVAVQQPAAPVLAEPVAPVAARQPSQALLWLYDNLLPELPRPTADDYAQVTQQNIRRVGC